jgi:hypothetical protein
MHEKGLEHFEVKPVLYLLITLAILFFINKPKVNDIQLNFWYSKWKLVLFVIFAILSIGTLYNIPTINYFYNYTIVIFGLPIAIGMYLTAIFLFLIFRVTVKKIWSCPSCKASFKFLVLGASKDVGLAINKCPNCKVELTKA